MDLFSGAIQLEAQLKLDHPRWPLISQNLCPVTSHWLAESKLLSLAGRAWRGTGTKGEADRLLKSEAHNWSTVTLATVCWSNQVTRKIMLKGVGEKLMPDDRGQHHNASGGTLGREGSESSRGFPLAASYSYSSLPQNILFPSQDQPKSYLVETVFSLGSQGLYQVYRQTRQLLVQGHIN